MNSELPQIEACLRGGGIVVAASERAARFIAETFHRARRGEGLTAWPSPAIYDWQTFVHNAWNDRSPGSLLVLNSIQEHSLWTSIVATAAPDAAPLAGARDRLAALAMDAHGLLCSFAPSLLNAKARSAWDRDAAAFSVWLSAFDELCRASSLISPARLPLSLIETLKSDPAARPPLLLAGFDRVTPAQQALFAAWGSVAELPLAGPASRIEFHSAPDPASELAACALWCNHRLVADPRSRLLVVTQEASIRRGEIERAFLRFAHSGAPTPAPLFEFSLGVPLGQIALARGAGLLLHWLTESISEHELDWLFSTGQLAASPEESLALPVFTRALRRKGLQRTRWSLSEFLSQHPGATLPASWVARLAQAQRRLAEFSRRPQSPIAWSELAPQLLQIAGWPGSRPLSSAEFQAHSRWLQILDDCASLGFDGLRLDWPDFLAALDRAVAEMLFAPESHDAPILIAGPAESAGLTAGAIWFLGADEESWPPRGVTHPLLPLAVQRQAGMPHASPKLDWDLASAITHRLLASAPEVHFSIPLQRDGAATRPSRVVVQLVGAPRPLPSDLAAPPAPAPLTIDIDDATQLPFPPGNAPGGAATLTAQSQCPFKAFAIARLGAQSWDPAEAGLTAAERGQLVHAVLHSVWAGPPRGIRAHAELLALPDLPAFVADHVRRALQSNLPPRARDAMPPRYLGIEIERLTGLVAEWLRYESTRVPFTVLDTEQRAAASVAGLMLHLRLDRVDRLIDNSLLVIDYKTGDIKPIVWDLPRPDDVQLPLYAGFALDPAHGPLGGLVFAKVRAGKAEFAGRVRDAKATLRADLRATTNLVKLPLTSGQTAAWNNYIADRAKDFLRGCAAPNPREYPDTCDRCLLHALCRIQENPPQPGENGEEAADA